MSIFDTEVSPGVAPNSCLSAKKTKKHCFTLSKIKTASLIHINYDSPPFFEILDAPATLSANLSLFYSQMMIIISAIYIEHDKLCLCVVLVLGHRVGRRSNHNSAPGEHFVCCQMWRLSCVEILRWFDVGSASQTLDQHQTSVKWEVLCRCE